LVHDQSIPVGGTFQEDLEQLQGTEVLQDDIPAYLLIRLDDPPTEWLAIYYVPDSAKVRDKMLYASTRASLLKSLGSTLFSDTIFATSKDDLTPEAYASHRRHIAAPKPLSAREQEMADVRAAEREDVGRYDGPRTHLSIVGTGVGFNWSEEAENAVKKLGESDGCDVAIITIDVKSETLVLFSASATSVEELGSTLPPSEPCYAFFGWPHSPSKRQIVFIYSCPSSSPVKHRMVYSSGLLSVFHAVKAILPPDTLASRKIETSDPGEINEEFLRTELGLTEDVSLTNTSIAKESGDNGDEKKPFARPKGPARRR